MKKITRCAVRMYNMGTGDFFLLQFLSSDDKVQFKLVIDCGVYNISAGNMKRFVDELHNTTEGKIDAILVTHEHNDHVLGFAKAQEKFENDFEVKEIWLPWTEEDDDSLVKEWKKEYGEKKKSLAFASALLKKSTKTKLYEDIYRTRTKEDEANDISFKTRLGIADSLMDFTALNTDQIDLAANGESALGIDDNYTDGLLGMRVVKGLSDKHRILQPGEVIEGVKGLDNIRIHVLGPPKEWDAVKQEHGKEGESYKHNKELNYVKGFSCLPFEKENSSPPFDEEYIISDDCESSIGSIYEGTDTNERYRRIDYDWLMSSANLSLRLTRAINNLSAVIAIEFMDTGRVMLFPGDAEIGSWKSWHKIKWKNKTEEESKGVASDLLKRTVFYKVAHHLSHNGTAKELGLEQMNHPDLVAMATVDYNRISSRWKNTMPNRAIVKSLLEKTKGRLLLVNYKGLFYDKQKKKPLIKEVIKNLDSLSEEEKKQYKENLLLHGFDDFELDDLENILVMEKQYQKPLYIQFTVNGN